MSSAVGNEHENEIGYTQSYEEGQCILKSIRPLRLVGWKYVLHIIYNILLVGFPALFCYWYIELERWLLYDFCDMADATHFYILNYDDAHTIVKKEEGQIYHNDVEKEQAVYFVNRFMKYYFDASTRSFVCIKFNSQPRAKTIINQKTDIIGYDPATVQTLRECYGKCAMELPRPSCPVLFVREVLQPFYLFIVYSVILWYYENYIYYASIILLTSVVSIAINLYQVIQLNNKIFNMAFYTTEMNVLRGSAVIQVDSIELVPGDIVFLKKSIKLPFDGILLGGSLLMNESALTGESVPIVKKAIDTQEFNQTNKFDKSCLIYEGTELVQLCSHSQNPGHLKYKDFGLMAMVTHCNFSTLKGQLIRVITFPKSRNIKFYTESAKFIGFLFLLSIISYAILISKLKDFVEPNDLALKFFDLITITVPPGLPASMSVGIVYSLNKLQKKNIFCISPDKIILGGRVEHICFDKTGTLTEQFMDFYEFVPKTGKSFLPAIKLSTKNLSENVKNLSTEDSTHALNNMASCHSIMNLTGTDKLIGDPMEIKLFEFGGFKLTENSPVNNQYKDSLFSFAGPNCEGTVFRRFEFNSEIHRMSVLASSTNKPNSAFIYCKGAPETMLKIMKPDGIPADYHQVLKKYTSCGFRVLAVANKPIDPKNIGNISREEAQKDLSFNGFQVFQNKLKPETVPAIKTLKQAGITVVIITGDNPLTGANIGFKSGVIESHLSAMIIDMLPNGRISVENFYEQNDGDGVMTTQETDNKFEPVMKVVGKKQEPAPNFECSVEQLPQRAIEIGKRGHGVFCITGAAFGPLFNTELTDEKKQLIKYIRVFARVKPNDKTRAIIVYQSMGKVTAMCGDGANDCGALKQSDAGLSLSEAEASISSPFTSKVPNISSMIELIKECRGGLATNFSLFNLMALYSLIQYTSTVITQFYYGYPADLQYLYWDIGCNFFFFLTIGYTASADSLSILRPNDSLFSVSNVICVLVMFIIQLVGQISVILLMANPPFNSVIGYDTNAGEAVNLAKYQVQTDFLLDTLEVQSIFMFSNFMYVFSVIAFCISTPWKKHFVTNPWFMIVLILVFTYDILICMVPESRIPDFMIGEFDITYRGTICGMAIAFGLFMYVLQKFVLEGLFNHLREKYPEKHWL